MLKYNAFVIRADGEIIALLLPDFYQVFKNQEGLEGCYSQAVAFIENEFKEGKKLPAASKFDQLNSFLIDYVFLEEGQNQQPRELPWELIEISVAIKRGTFSKALPAIGHIANILTVLASGAIAFMSLRIASSKKESDNPDLSKALSLSGAILSAIIGFTMYVYSGATEVLVDIGHKLDVLLSKIFRRICCIASKKSNSIVGNNVNAKYYHIRNAVSMLTIGGISANTIIVGISTYQEINSIVENYLKLFSNTTSPEYQHNKEILDWSVTNLYLLVGAYTTLSFQGSFAPHLVNSIMKRICKYNENESSSSQAQLFAAEHQPGLYFSGVNQNTPLLNNNEDALHDQSINRENQVVRRGNEHSCTI